MTDPRVELAKLPEAISPPVLPEEPNAPVDLYTGPLSLKIGDREYSLRGSLQLAWLPTPEIRITGSGDIVWTATGNTPTTVSIPGLLRDAGCVVVAVSHSSSSATNVRGFLKRSEVCGDESVSLTAIEFSLVNFHSYIGRPVRPKGSDAQMWSGRRSFHMGEWDVIVDAIPGAAAVKRRLAGAGGFGVAHAGRLVRRDGGVFVPGDAEPALDALHFLFAFMRGFWCGPIMPVGVSASEAPWRLLRVPILTPWRTCRSWYPQETNVDLGEAASRFWELWQDPEWQTPLRHAIWWYVEANSAGSSESGLIMAQAALELLGWVVLVESAGALSAAGFDKLPASDKIRALLGHLRIPLDIPDGFGDLAAYAKGVGEPDGPGVFARMRNAIVHPSIKKREMLAQASPGAKHDGKELGLRALELCLLSAMGYTGQYTDRASRGVYRRDAEVEVPWARQ